MRAPDLDSAAPLPVSERAQIAGLDIRMRTGASYAIRGTVKKAYDMHLELVRRGQRVFSAAPVAARIDDEDGKFEILGVSPRDYRVLASDMGR